MAPAAVSRSREKAAQPARRVRRGRALLLSGPPQPRLERRRHDTMDGASGATRMPDHKFSEKVDIKFETIEARL